MSALVERAIGYTRTSLTSVAQADPAAPTPCAAWDLRALLRHMDDSLAAFTEAAELGYVACAPTPRGPNDLAGLVDSLKSRACALLGAWSAEPPVVTVSVGGRRMPAALLAASAALEIAVHGWDVAQACGTDRPIPEPLARDLLDVAPHVVGAGDRPTRFAWPYDVPAGSASDRLLAYLGRSATRWSSAA